MNTTTEIQPESPLDWPLQTRFFRDESGDLIIEQQQADGDTVAVVVPAINLSTFLIDVTDVCGVMGYPMKWNWGENPAPGKPCPDGSYVGRFTAGVEQSPIFEMAHAALERPAPEHEPRRSALSAAERQRRYRERKRNDRNGVTRARDENVTQRNERNAETVTRNAPALLVEELEEH